MSGPGGLPGRGPSALQPHEVRVPAKDCGVYISALSWVSVGKELKNIQLRACSIILDFLQCKAP